MLQMRKRPAGLLSCGMHCLKHGCSRLQWGQLLRGAAAPAGQGRHGAWLPDQPTKPAKHAAQVYPLNTDSQPAGFPRLLQWSCRVAPSSTLTRETSGSSCSQTRCGCCFFCAFFGLFVPEELTISKDVIHTN